MSSYSPDRNNRLSGSPNHVNLINALQQGQHTRPYVRNFYKSSEVLVKRMKVSSMLTGHSGCVNSVLFSKSCETIITGSDDMHVNMYKYGQSSPIHTFNTLHRNNIFYARDLDEENGKYITCAADGRVILMNIERDFSHKTANDEVLHKHKGRAHRISICPDSSDMFFSAGEDGVICLFDLRSSISSLNPDDAAESRAIMRTKFTSTKHRASSVYAICVNHVKPNYLAACGSSQYVCIYDTRKFSTPISYYCPRHLRNERLKHVSGIKFDYSCEHILASFNDEAVYRLNIDRHAYDASVPTANAIAKSPISAPVDSLSSSNIDDEFDDRERGYCNVYRGHRNRDTVKQVAFYGTRSEFVVSGSDCGHLFLWDTQTSEIANIISADSRGAINCITSHDTLPILAVSGLDEDAKLIEPTADFNVEAFERTKEKVVNINQSRRSTLWDTQSISSALQHLLAHDIIDGDSVPTAGIANLIAMMLAPHEDSDESEDIDDEDVHSEDGDEDGDNDGDDDTNDDGNEEELDAEADDDGCGDDSGDDSSGSARFVFNFDPHYGEDLDSACEAFGNDEHCDDGGDDDDCDCGDDGDSGVTAPSVPTPRERTASDDERASALINMVREAVGAKAKKAGEEADSSSDKKQRRS